VCNARLNWFEVTYWRSYRALGGYLDANSGDATGLFQVHADGFSSAAIQVYDLTDSLPVRLATVSIRPADPGQYTVDFQDSTGTTPRRYVIWDSPKPLPSGHYSAVTRRHLTAASGEQDYLLVVPEAFLPAVAPLAQLRRASWKAATTAVAFAGLGLVQLAGVATGGNDPFAPLAHLGAGTSHATEFRRVKSVAELDAILAAAPGKTVMLDFYADWCVSCKEMEKFTFSDARVQAEFAGMLLLQADVTANDEHDKAMLKRFGLFGPPGIIFFDPAGAEIKDTRVIGYQNTDKFLQSLAATRGR
jgi:thiol-disulfide isomerase/thioredoxin